MPRLKSILASPLLIVKVFRKSKIDNFVGGLLIGAVFSLIVNIFTVGIQETVHKQRVLEALENEIVNHMLLSTNVIISNADEIKKNSLPNYFHNTRVYSDRVWNNSESLQYIMELDTAVQSSLMSYYSAIIENINLLNQRYLEYNSVKLQNCYSNEANLTIKQKDDCLVLYYNNLKAEAQSADLVYNHAEKTLKEGFHPTQDRLNNPLLRLIMGSKSVNILSSARDTN